MRNFFCTKWKGKEHQDIRHKNNKGNEVVDLDIPESSHSIPDILRLGNTWEIEQLRTQKKSF